MSVPGSKNVGISGQLATTVPSSIVFQRSGNVTSGSYLQIGTVISSTTGFPIRVTDGFLSFISVQNENIDTFNVEVFEWDGTTETLLATVVVSSALGADFSPPTEIPITFGQSLRCKIASGSSKNPIVLVYIVGDVPV